MSHNHDGKSKKLGDPAAAARVVAMLEGKPVQEFVPLTKREGESKWHVRGFDSDITWQDLREWLDPSGSRVTEIHIFCDSITRVSRGFAVVRLVGNPESLNGKLLRGRPITVTPWIS